jgi:lipoprotein NlpI
MRIAMAVGVLLLCCQAASAAAYDDFAQGVAANIQGDSELAIKSFTAAIAAPDLNPSLLLQAYRGRAEAYLREDKCHAALPDLDQALKINATDWAALLMRANVRMCDGDLAGGEADFGAAIAVKPTPKLYFARGRARFRQQNFSGAAEDFVLYAPEKAKRAYRVLWLEMARRRGGTLDAKTAAADIETVDSDDWPAPLLALYAGTKTPDAALAAVKDGPDHQQCEADFYVAEWHLGGNDTDAARALLQKAVADCPPDFVEFHEAHFELGRLK